MAKGSEFERTICRQLSLWFSGGAHDDLYWRTSNSGGRMTVRGRKGKSTRTHCGDICAVVPEGQPLIDTITWELKRGYGRHTVHDMLDVPGSGAVQEWQKWFDQAEASRKLAGTPYWMIIARRDRREATAWMPQKLWADLQLQSISVPAIMLRVGETKVVGVTLDKFLALATPERIKELGNGKRNL